MDDLVKAAVDVAHRNRLIAEEILGWWYQAELQLCKTPAAMRKAYDRYQNKLGELRGD